MGTDYRSKFSGPTIDEAVNKMFEFDIDSNGCIRLKSAKDNPYDIDYLQVVGNYIVYYFIHGSESMNHCKPARIRVTYIDDILTQMSFILDEVQFRTFQNDEWSEWETWYSTGYIYQQPDMPKNPQKDCLWIDTSDILNPVMKIYDKEAKIWREVRPSDAMDISIYDPTHKGIDIYEYVEQRILELDFDEATGKRFSELFAEHVSNTSIHFKRLEKDDFLDRPTRTEVANKMDENEERIKHIVTVKIDQTVEKIDSIIEELVIDEGTMLTHYADTIRHTTAQEKEIWHSKADGNHTHILDDRVKINAKNVEGVFKLEQLPLASYEVVVKVPSDTDRFLLKKEPEDDDLPDQKYVQNGDTVYVEDTLSFYFVVNDEALDSETGYTKYAGLLPEQIEWDRIIATPTTRDGYGITDVPTYDEMYKILGETDGLTVKYITTILARSSSIPDIKGYLTLYNDPYMIASYEMIDSIGFFLKLSDSHPSICTFDFNDKEISTETPYTHLDNSPIFTDGLVSILDGNEAMSVASYHAPAYYYYLGMSRQVSQITALVPDEIVNSSITFVYALDTKQLWRVVREEGTAHYVSMSYKRYMYVVSLASKIYLCYNTNGELFVTTIPLEENKVTDNTIVLWGDHTEDDIHYFAKEAILIYGTHLLSVIDLDGSALYSFDLGDSYVILQTYCNLQTHLVYVIAYETIPATPTVNAGWTAYKLNTVILSFDITENSFRLYRKYILEEGEIIYEVSMEEGSDYSAFTKNMFLDQHKRSMKDPKPIHMEFSNGAFIVFCSGKPKFSILLSGWSDMYTSFINIKDNSIEKDTITSEMNYLSSEAKVDLPTTLCVKREDMPYISYDGYNYYELDDKSIYYDKLNRVMVMKNISVNDTDNLLLLQMENEVRETLSYAIYYGQTTIDTSVNNIIEELDKKVKEETGALSTNVIYSQFDQILNTPVNITGENNALININIAQYDVRDVDKYFRYNMVNGNSIISIPSIMGGPSGYEHYYIKGGFYSNTQYVWVMFTYETNKTPDIGFGMLSSTGISIMSYLSITSLKDATPLAIEKWIKGMSIKTYRIDNILYGYMQFSANNTEGLDSFTNYPVFRAFYETGEMATHTVSFDDLFINENAITSIIRIYLFNKRIYLVRANNEEYSLSIFSLNDYFLLDNYTHAICTYSMLNPYPIRCLPEPFMIEDKFTFAYTNKNGNVFFTQIDLSGDVVYIESRLNIVDTSGLLKKQYSIYHDYDTDSMLFIHIGTLRLNSFTYQTDEIIVYFLADGNELESGGGIQYQGKISDSILKGYTNGNSFVFPELLPIHSNYNFGLLCASWFEPVQEDSLPYGAITPIIRITRDTGPETLRRIFDLTTIYIKKLNEYQDKFEMIVDQSSHCVEYADQILELIG